MAIGCKRCGRCCCTAGVVLDPRLSPQDAEFTMARIGATTMWRDEDGTLRALVGRCPHLSTDGRTCLVYDYRPQTCREHPTKQDKVLPGCKYYDDSKEVE